MHVLSADEVRMEESLLAERSGVTDEGRRAGDEVVACVEGLAEPAEALPVLELRGGREVGQKRQQRLEGGIENEVVDVEDERCPLDPDARDDGLEAGRPGQPEEHHDRVGREGPEQGGIVDVHHVRRHAGESQLLDRVLAAVAVGSVPRVGDVERPQHRRGSTSQAERDAMVRS